LPPVVPFRRAKKKATAKLILSAISQPPNCHQSAVAHVHSSKKKIKKKGAETHLLVMTERKKFWVLIKYSTGIHVLFDSNIYCA